MTAIFYPDIEAQSPSGRFRLEARSPQNGAIAHRDGRPATEAEFAFKYREHQRDFRYRLLDRDLAPARRAVVWERFQSLREDSPHELIVADDGWAIIRTHGFAPEIIAVGPNGRDALRVRLTGPGGDADTEELGRPLTNAVWSLAHLSWSTAGNFWSSHSWRGFVRSRDRPYFAWRAWWGQRLVLDLANAVALSDERLVSDEINAAADEAERVGVRSLLADLSPQMGEVHALLSRPRADIDEAQRPLAKMLQQTTAALHLVGVHRLRECVPYLREWEELDIAGGRTGSSAIPGRWWLERQRFRPIVHHALKLLGEEPRGRPTYRFVAGDFDRPTQLPMPDHVPDRRQRAASVHPMLSAQEVLHLLGSPDFIRRRFREDVRPHRWVEHWEYDHRAGSRWRTLRITWEEERRQGRIKAIAEVAPYWLDFHEREAEFLGF